MVFNSHKFNAAAIQRFKTEYSMANIRPEIFAMQDAKTYLALLKAVTL
jgi:hypothetical protein